MIMKLLVTGVPSKDKANLESLVDTIFCSMERNRNSPSKEEIKAMLQQFTRKVNDKNLSEQ